MHLTPNMLRVRLKGNGYDPSVPLLVSLDCDRTLVDRSRGSHAVSQAVADYFCKLKEKRGVIVVINTGRDWASYQPLIRYFGYDTPCLFVSGRVMHYDGQRVAHPESLLPRAFLSNITDFALDQQLPYLDVKTPSMNVFWKSSETPEQLFCPFKPFDWMDGIAPRIEPMEELCHDALLESDPVRLEIPILKRMNPSLFELVKRGDKPSLAEWAHRTLSSDALEVLSIPSRKELADEITTLRLMSSNSKVNKGIGLKTLAERMSIPERNIIAVGDSNDDTAGDCIIKTHLPNSILCTLGTPNYRNIDFILQDATKDGILPLFKALLDQP